MYDVIKRKWLFGVRARIIEIAVAIYCAPLAMKTDRV